MGPFTSIFVMQSLFANLLTSPHHVSTSVNDSPQALLTNHHSGGSPYLYQTEASSNSLRADNKSIILLSLLNTSDSFHSPRDNNHEYYLDGNEKSSDFGTSSESSLRPRRQSPNDEHPDNAGGFSLWNIFRYFREKRATENEHDNAINNSPDHSIIADQLHSRKSGRNDNDNADGGGTVIYEVTYDTAHISGLRIEVSEFY